jgi:hypothetical protein
MVHSALRSRGKGCVEVYAPTPWDAKAAFTTYTRKSGHLFEPFDLNLSDDELVAWGAKHMDEMGQEYWPRGKRPWPND